MSESKRGGSRDISELKQRLGLKKATPPAAAQPRGNGATGGVVPPPGLNLPPPAPAQPVIPNAADDPFGAMNAMAAVGTVQRAPEIVIVNDGRPVEDVGASGHGARIAKIVVPAVVALGVGIAIGQIARSANLYNAGLKDARAILGEVEATSTVKYVKRALSDLERELDEMKSRSYRPSPESDKKLSDVAVRLDAKTATVFRTANAIDPEVNAQIMSFYAGAAELKGMLDAHVRAAKADSQALVKAMDASEAATVKEGENAALAGMNAVRYGALIQAPTDTDKDVPFGVRIVELGAPYCGGTNPVTTGKCDNNEAPTAYAYRNEPGGLWTKGELQTLGSDAVPAKKLVLLLPNGTRDALIKGGEPGASEVFYVKRLAALAARAKKLLDEGNKLEQRLQAESNKGTRFSFFM